MIILKDTAFVFPGQATHYTGMGKEIYDNFKEARDVYHFGSEIAGVDLAKLCFDGPDDILVKTENSQPTIHTTSIAVLAVLKEKYGFSATASAGFSLGQYSALVNAGALQYKDTVKLVKNRGMYMENAVNQGLGKMVAIAGLERDQIYQIVEDSKHLGHIEPSNFNCPGQTIVAGYNAPVEHAAKLAEERGAALTVFLAVSGPFHTRLLIPAGNNLRKRIFEMGVEVKEPEIDYVDNVMGDYYVPGQDLDIIELLRQHVFKPVMWEDSVNAMLDRGVRTFVEIGPSKNKMLTGLNLRTAEKKGIKVECFNIDNMENLTEGLKKLEKLAKDQGY
jgi:[acyl-carrier-protein] S-malonyltransferase